MAFWQKIRLMVVLLGISGAVQLYGESKSFVPDAPVIKFKLPMFNKEGFKVWDMQGDKGTYLSDEEVEVETMLLHIFSGDEETVVEATVESPQAMLLIKQDRAYGSEEIEVEGARYYLTGREWEWNGTHKRMTINKDVRVVFEQSLGTLLSYEE